MKERHCQQDAFVLADYVQIPASLDALFALVVFDRRVPAVGVVVGDSLLHVGARQRVVFICGRRVRELRRGRGGWARGCRRRGGGRGGSAVGSGGAGAAVGLGRRLGSCCGRGRRPWVPWGGRLGSCGRRGHGRGAGVVGGHASPWARALQALRSGRRRRQAEAPWRRQDPIAVSNALTPAGNRRSLDPVLFASVSTSCPARNIIFPL